jgi:hypothetical protein
MIAKEWLEDIKERFAKYEYDYNLNGEDVEWLIQQAEKIELLNAEIETLQAKWEAQGLMIQKLHRENQRYKQALEYIQRAIYTQHCTKNHKWNTEFEKGQISGLIQASNIVDKAIRKVEGEA